MSKHYKMFNFNPKFKKDLVFNLEALKQNLNLVLCIFGLVLLMHGCNLNLELSLCNHSFLHCEWKLNLIDITLFHLEIDSRFEHGFFLDLSNFIIRDSSGTLEIYLRIYLQVLQNTFSELE